MNRKDNSHPTGSSLTTALLLWPTWLWFAKQDLRSRYRGSVIGPFWLVLNLGMLVAALSLIYATIFGLELQVYVPHITTGFLAWFLITHTVNESCTAFISNSQLIRNYPLPLGVHVLRVLARNFFLMLHNLIVYGVVALSFGISLNVNTLLVIPGTILVCLLLFFSGFILATLCARYRDIPHIVSNVMQVVMFITPIMFLKDMLSRKAFLAEFNPIYHMIEAIRAPLLGTVPELTTWGFLIVANIVTAFIAFKLMKQLGHRVPFWI
ncbi:MAG: ABC transporter permease [Pontibacterium sp.]